jgi:cytoskeletal protein RodZ
MISGFGYAAMLNKKFKKRLTFGPLLFFVAGYCFVWLSTCLAAQNSTELQRPEIFQSRNGADVRQNNFLVAENSRNDEEKKSSDSTPRREPDTQNETKTETETQTPDQKGKTDPLKSYQPSEKVKADQVVDFPYDI